MIHKNELASCFPRLSSWAWAIWILESDFLLLWCGVSSLKVRLLNPKRKKKEEIVGLIFLFWEWLPCQIAESRICGITFLKSYLSLYQISKASKWQNPKDFLFVHVMPTYTTPYCILDLLISFPTLNFIGSKGGVRIEKCHSLTLKSKQKILYKLQPIGKGEWPKIWCFVSLFRSWI